VCSTLRGILPYDFPYSFNGANIRTLRVSPLPYEVFSVVRTDFEEPFKGFPSPPIPLLLDRTKPQHGVQTPLKPSFPPSRGALSPSPFPELKNLSSLLEGSPFICHGFFERFLLPFFSEGALSPSRLQLLTPPCRWIKGSLLSSPTGPLSPTQRTFLWVLDPPIERLLPTIFRPHLFPRRFFFC